MSESLSDAIAAMRESAARLNKITDDAAKVVARVESFLNDECSLGLNAGVEVSRWEVPGAPFTEYVHLDYRRVGNRFRIAVVQFTDMDDPEDMTVRPWSDCARDVKFETFEKLPDLLLEIAKRADDEAKKAQSVVAKTEKLITALIGEAK